MRYGSANFRRIDQANRAREVERTAWAGPALVMAEWEITAPGTAMAGPFMFATVFEEPPHFSWGVELMAGTLQGNDYPQATCGIAGWVIKETRTNGPVLFLGAEIFITVQCQTSYPLRFRFGFEGVALRNPELIGVV